jgi:hypothetical protein
MPANRTGEPGSTNPAADAELHRRLLAMPAANDTPESTEPRFFSFFTAWNERRFAAEYCRRLMRVQQTVAASHPGLAGMDLYRLVVAEHVGSDPGSTEALLDRAQESYALWPVPRALTFRDVVHYLAVSSYWALHHGQRWICSDIRRVVDSSIPRHL